MSSFFFPEITVVMLLFHPYGKLTSVNNGVNDRLGSNVKRYLMLKPTDAAEANVDDTVKGKSS